MMGLRPVSLPSSTCVMNVFQALLDDPSSKAGTTKLNLVTR